MIDVISWVMVIAFMSMKIDGVIDWHWVYIIMPLIIDYGGGFALSHLFSSPWRKK